MISANESSASLLYYLHDCFPSLSGEKLHALISRLKKEASKNTGRDPFYFKKDRTVEFFRKILMRLGLCHDVISLTHRHTTDRISLLRYSIAGAASLSLPASGCRFLLRVDDFPSSFAPSNSFPLFHQIAKDHGMPYLLAVTPYLKESGLSGTEIEMLQKCRGEGMTPALHGFTHKRIGGNIPSELLGLPAQELRNAAKKCCAYLKTLSMEPSVFVAPFNSYDAKTLGVLTELFPVLCGGPESTASLGYRGPGFIGESLYLPSYRGAYDVKNDLSWIHTVKREGHGLIIPITLHWHNELKDHFMNFKQLCKIIQPQTISWDEILTLHRRILKAVHPS